MTLPSFTFMKMYSKQLLVVILFAPLFIKAQRNGYLITGQVVDAVTNTPLPSASVFAQNTTFGTATDKEGKFYIKLPNGGYDLVFSYTGYRSLVLKVNSKDADQPITITLQRKPEEMEAVVIMSNKNMLADGWEQFGKFFLANFLGTTANSADCELTNHAALKFYYFKKQKLLKVMSNDPLEIVNNALGYTITYSMDSFVYDFKRQVTTYTGYPLFTPISSNDPEKIFTWKKNRQQAYAGSVLHLMRSIYNKTVIEDGFELKWMPNIKKPNKTIIIDSIYTALNYSRNDTAGIAIIQPLQPELVVVYKKAGPEKRYLYIERTARSYQQQSRLSFVMGQPITIEENGFYYRQTLISKSDYYSWTRWADALPYDYENK